MKAFVVAVLFVGAFACRKSAAQECSVGELGNTVAGGICNGAKPAESCVAYCKKTYDREFITGACTPKRANGKSECICNIKCVSAGQVGSGHIWSFKSQKKTPTFTYKGIHKHYFIKSIKKFTVLPQFELRHKNKPHPKNKLNVIPDISELFVANWNLTVAINTPDNPQDKFGLTINGKVQTIPFRHSITDEHREHFCDVKFHPKNPNQLIVETSFGKRIVYESHASGDFSYSDIHVHVAKHPEIKGNIQGLLGQFDDNPVEDFVDATGKKVKVDSKFSFEFGDSWIVPGVVEKTVVETYKVQIKTLTVKAQAKVCPQKRRRIQSLCTKNIEIREVSDCATAIGQIRMSVDDCVNDLINLDTEKDIQNALTAIQQKFKANCPATAAKLEVKPHIELSDPNWSVVGEYIRTSDRGICNEGEGDKNAACANYCRTKFPDESKDGKCRDENEDGKSECVCNFKRAVAGCLGDPHCFSFDSPVKNPTFSYMGLVKHWLIRPNVKKENCFKYLPRFELRQTNKKWQKGPAAILELSELKIIDWKLTVEINVPDSPDQKFALKVNGQDEAIPYTFIQNKDFHEDYLIVVPNPKTPNQLVIETSFGLRIRIDNHPAGPTNTYSDLHVEIPRHPDLKGCVEGLLGNFNDNPKDDNIDCNGKPQKLDGFSWEYGNSWIIPTNNSKEEAERYQLDAVKLHAEFTAKISIQVKTKIEVLCRQNFENNKDLDDCSDKIQQYYPSVDNCIFDLQYHPDPNKAIDLIKAVHKKFSVHCEKEIITRPHPIDKNCAVGELEKVDQDGLCNGNDKPEEKCANYCKEKYAGEFIQSECRGQGKRECICSVKCGNAGCWGDPHCWTFDSAGKVVFSYQGRKKYWVVKPKQAFKTFVNFELRQTNKPWADGPMSILDQSELVVPDWKQTVVITAPSDPAKPSFTVTVNDQVIQKLPFLYSKFDEYRENYINIAISDKDPNQLILWTSFGLRITYSAHPQGTLIYSDVSVDLPRHPEVKGNVVGLLGNFNDNPNDDNLDSSGKVQPWDDYSWDFGNSWLVPANWTPAHIEEERKRIEILHEQLTVKITVKKKLHVETMCRENIVNHKQFAACAELKDERVHSERHCVTDLLNMKTETDMKNYIRAIHKKFAAKCDVEIKTQTDEVCHRNLLPLYRLFNAALNDHLYTVDFDEALEAVNKQGYKFEKSPGFVKTSNDDCHGTETHKPVYRLFKAGPTPKDNDHFYTIDEWEADGYARNQKYTREGTGFYCSHKPNDCGATVPLYRYRTSDEHFYTHDEQEGEKSGGKFDGISCYIWPHPGGVEQN